jgi:hypothetical protein
MARTETDSILHYLRGYDYALGGISKFCSHYNISLKCNHRDVAITKSEYEGYIGWGEILLYLAGDIYPAITKRSKLQKANKSKLSNLTEFNKQIESDLNLICDYFDSAIKQNPNYPDAYLYKGFTLIYWFLLDYTQSIKLSLDHTRMFNSPPRAISDSIDLFNQAIGFNHRFAQAYLYRSIAYYLESNYPDASRNTDENDYRGSIKTSYKKAIDDYNTAINYDSNVVYLLEFKFGKAPFKKIIESIKAGKPIDAEKILRKIIRRVFGSKEMPISMRYTVPLSETKKREYDLIKEELFKSREQYFSKGLKLEKKNLTLAKKSFGNAIFDLSKIYDESDYIFTYGSENANSSFEKIKIQLDEYPPEFKRRLQLAIRKWDDLVITKINEVEKIEERRRKRETKLQQDKEIERNLKLNKRYLIILGDILKTINKSDFDLLENILRSNKFNKSPTRTHIKPVGGMVKNLENDIIKSFDLAFSNNLRKHHIKRVESILVCRDLMPSRICSAPKTYNELFKKTANSHLKDSEYSKAVEILEFLPPMTYEDTIIWTNKLEKAGKYDLALRLYNRLLSTPLPKDEDKQKNLDLAIDMEKVAYGLNSIYEKHRIEAYKKIVIQFLQESYSLFPGGLYTGRDDTKLRETLDKLREC